ncbi:MAG: nucleotide sugar dehydrogenase [Bacteroidales bacterium]|nr:nucleotide sugar dehydrogenase [Bacteroidales bacterium]
MKKRDIKDVRIGVIGLGYVGFPLACLFSRKYPVVAFDINSSRVEALNRAEDSTLEVSSPEIRSALDSGMLCTCNIEDLRPCNFYIVTVPTPVNENNYPDLRPLEKASETVGGVLSEGDIVVYESTVYPGVTEEVCAPILEKYSSLTLNKDFFLGYSPERINPGDKEHTVAHILKITSGSTPEVAEFIDNVYNSVLLNGTFKASSIKVAEAAKIIENSQRDVNIAFMNEVAMIMNALGIDTLDVLEAAGTKWNFLPFRPGLVGGHCISVDPYYLIQKAQFHGILPRIMTESRRVNDAMGNYVASQVVNSMTLNGNRVKDSSILILGFTFKENCPDIRNTKVVNIYNYLTSFTDNITVCDPWVDSEDAMAEYGVKVVNSLPNEDSKKYDAIVLCVNHTVFHTLDLKSMISDRGVIYDVKGAFPREIVSMRL